MTGYLRDQPADDDDKTFAAALLLVVQAEIEIVAALKRSGLRYGTDFGPLERRLDILLDEMQKLYARKTREPELGDMDTWLNGTGALR